MAEEARGLLGSELRHRAYARSDHTSVLTEYSLYKNAKPWHGLGFHDSRLQVRFPTMHGPDPAVLPSYTVVIILCYACAGTTVRSENMHSIKTLRLAMHERGSASFTP
jgi:hypothetical protein